MELMSKNYYKVGKKVKNIEFAGAAVQGINHVKSNIPCQDYIFSKTFNNITVIALADGAGSYKQTEVGAKISTEFVANFICDNFQILFNLIIINIIKMEYFKYPYYNNVQKQEDPRIIKIKQNAKAQKF